MRYLLAGAFALGLLSGAAHAIDESDLLPVDQAFALGHEVAADGTVQLHWQIAEGYYLYRHRFEVKPVDPASYQVLGLDLPKGLPKHDEFFGDTEIYRQQVSASVRGTASSAGAVELRVKYQGCADLGICYPPQTRSLTLQLPANSAAPGLPASQPAFAALGNSASPLAIAPAIGSSNTPLDTLPLPPEQAFAAEAIASNAKVVLLRFTPAPGYYLYRDKTELAVVSPGSVQLRAPQWPPATPHNDEHFGDVAVYFDQVEVPLPLSRSDAAATTLELALTLQGCQTDGICYPPMKRRLRVELPAITDASVDAAAPADSAATGEFGFTATVAALLLALAGGLILNLMPCVLPVLSLKVIGLAGSGESASKARKHALWYTAGVLLSFAAVGLAALTLRSAGLALGWGFQLQQPLVVAVLTYVMLAVALNLSGLYQFGAGVTGIGQSLTEKQGATGDFFTGVLAVVVATPCTAPFMGSALAFAFTAPTALAVAVFLALGLGLALPFLLVGFIPGLAQRLPRPGVWMDTFKQALAFPMYLTAAWLAWVLAKQRGADAIGWVMIGAIALAAALWAWGHWQARARRWALVFALLAAVAAVVPLVYIHHLPIARAATASAADASIAYSADRLEQLRRDGRVVFVNMTADWCVTCKANEKAVLSQDAFKQALAAANAVYMKGDWTNVDPEITHFLEQHQAFGVPLYVVFPAGGGDGVKLPAVLTANIVEQALSDAAR